jgi:predicted transcriptional regulator
MGRPTTVRLDETMTRDLDTLAAATERSRGWHIEQALRRYLAEEAWQVGAVRAALDEYHAGTGEVAAHEAVMGRLEARIRAADPSVARP